MSTKIKMLVGGALAGAALTMGVGVAQADPFDPWIPGIPGPGVNIGVPGNPLPPGQVKKYIPNVDDVVPNWGAPGHWH
ncbi:hypothetical protein [Mycolicibacterium sp.]|uniref:hypothetical protein n=1 Tax=Mycolicibacterium sp. TaxID=2320850 RepID=UPI0025DC67AE|nr:hypothetical protein [Mycolicibacterium sp.]MCB9410802.1 hypothetical protein [Mycolicibacterium sp.]